MNIPVEHVVVLMLENRSFDHLFGFLDHPKKFNGLTGTETNPTSKIDATPVKVSKKAVPHITPDPGHSHSDILTQMHLHSPGKYPAKNDGFHANFADVIKKKKKKTKPEEIMKCFNPSDGYSKTLNYLAKKYVLCDNWFSSLPGETQPNRHFVHTGQSYGRVNNKLKLIKDPTTIYNTLDKHGISWNIYTNGLNLCMQYIRVLKNLKHGGFRSFKRKFEKDVKSGELANYVFIEPRHMFWRTNNMHPGNNKKKSSKDFKRAENLISEVYNTLLSNKKVWEKTLLVITFDEHGGFYDHEPPPKCVRPNSIPGELGFKFNQYGIRVPSILISPHFKPGHVDNKEYDHTSIIKSVFEAFSIPGHLTNRDKKANSFWHNILKKKSKVKKPKGGKPKGKKPQHRKLKLHELKETDTFKRKVSKEKYNDLQKDLVFLGNEVYHEMNSDIVTNENTLLRTMGISDTNPLRKKARKSIKVNWNLDGDALDELFLQMYGK